FWWDMRCLRAHSAISLRKQPPNGCVPSPSSESFQLVFRARILYTSRHYSLPGKGNKNMPMLRLTRFLAGIALASGLVTSVQAQCIYGTLTGIVSDPSQAVVSGATVTFRDQQSGSQRDTTTNSDGYYSFSSVPPGTYLLTVSAPGFDTFKQTSIALGGGDKLN